MAPSGFWTPRSPSSENQEWRRPRRSHEFGSYRRVYDAQESAQETYGSRVRDSGSQRMVWFGPKKGWHQELSLARLPTHLLLSTSHGGRRPQDHSDTGRT